MSNRVFIFAGPANSGKHALARKIAADTDTVILREEMFWTSPYLDDYDFDWIAAALYDLKAGRSVSVAGKTVEPAKNIIYIDRFGLYNEKIRDAADLKVYTDCPSDIALTRQIQSKTAPVAAETLRNYSTESAAELRKVIVDPAEHADIVVKTGGGISTGAIILLKTFCKN